MATSVEAAVVFMETVANDPTYGYSQIHRNMNPDFDCSSLVCLAFEWAGGIPVTSVGGSTYTGNMRSGFLAVGFTDITNQVNIQTGEGLIRGDVLLSASHTEVYAGNGLSIGAHCDENGDIYGNIPGDQTGHEISIEPYYPFANIVLRYVEKDAEINKAVIGDTSQLLGIAKVVNVYPDVLNVRIGNGMQYKRLPEYDHLNEGDGVAVWEVRGDWAYVSIWGKYFGWVAVDYLQMSR